MRIGIDITFLADQYSRRGIGNYGRELISRLIQNKEITWIFFGFGSLEENLQSLGVKKTDNLEFITLGYPRKSNVLNLYRFKFQMLPKIKKANLDLYFAPHLERGLPVGTVKTAIMIHDVIPYITNSYSQRGSVVNFLKGLFYKYNLNSARKADLIFVNSEFTKTQVIEKADFPEEKIIKTPLAVADAFRARNISQEEREIRRVLIMYKISKPYVLYYGGLEDNKNVETLIRAYAKVTNRFPDLKLVLAGKEFRVGWDSKPQGLTPAAVKILNLVINLKLKHKVIITGEIDFRHLPIVLANSKVYLNLSEYEGFGISVLEAVSAGVPVLAANKTSYPEVLKDSAILVDPHDVEKISHELQVLIQDDKKGQALIKRALKVAEEYDWKTTAQLTLDGFKHLAETTKKLRIAYLVPYFHPFKGGAENNTLEIAKRMVTYGHDVTVFTSKERGTLIPKHEDHQGIKIRRFTRLNDQYYLGIYPGLISSFLFSKFDVVHAHGFGFIFHDLVLIIKRLFSPHTKFINTPHGPFMALKKYSAFEEMLKRSYTFMQKLFLNRIYHRVIKVNPRQDEWIKDYRIDSKKLVYLPNGISSSLLNKEKTSKLETDLALARKIVISFIGRYEKYKGLEDLINVLPEILKIKKNVKLVALGTKGEYFDELERMVVDLNLEKNVELLIRPDDDIKAKILEISKIFVMASEWEAFGISVLEAMAKANAVVSTKTEGGEFLIKSGINGYLYNYGDRKQLQKHLTSLMNNSRLLKTMQKNNQEKAKEFLWDDIAGSYNKLLNTLTK